MDKSRKTYDMEAEGLIEACACQAIRGFWPPNPGKKRLYDCHVALTKLCIGLEITKTA